MNLEIFERRLFPIPMTGCLIWMGCLTDEGYGRFEHDGREYRAHRWYYQKKRRRISDDLLLDHLCRVRSCCNPHHLEPVSSRENTLRGIGVTARNALKTHCPRGHPYDEQNTKRDRNSNGRKCRTCCNASMREARARTRAAP
jgi:HNH endonuclease